MIPRAKCATRSPRRWSSPSSPRPGPASSTSTAGSCEHGSPRARSGSRCSTRPPATARRPCSRAWQQADPRRPFAWISLDGADADPQRFWSYVGEAVRRTAPDAELGAPGDLPRLINAIRALPRAVVLVLEDYHRLGDSEVHEQLAVLLERGPPNLRVVLSTRSGLPFPVARLRASLDLVVLSCDDLRFSPEEATALLNERLGLGLGEPEITQLLARTDGWPAGLYLAGVERSESGQGHLMDYFATEVLGGLSRRGSRLPAPGRGRVGGQRPATGRHARARRLRGHAAPPRADEPAGAASRPLPPAPDLPRAAARHARRGGARAHPGAQPAGERVVRR